MKVHVIYKSIPDGYDGSITIIIEVHTDINAANNRVKELDKTVPKDSDTYYDYETVDLIDSTKA